MSVGDAFDAEGCEFEVEEESGFEAGDVEVAEHLGKMVVIEAGRHFWIDDECDLRR